MRHRRSLDTLPPPFQRPRFRDRGWPVLGMLCCALAVMLTGCTGTNQPPAPSPRERVEAATPPPPPPPPEPQLSAAGAPSSLPDASAIVGVNFSGEECTGIVLAKGWVLTAAHCTPPCGSQCAPATSNLIKVWLPGATGWTAVASYYRNYIPDLTYTDDIALLKVGGASTGVPRVDPGWMPNATTQLYFMGWRNNNPSGGSVTFVAYNPDCLADKAESDSKFSLDANKTICTKPQAYLGDSGGPLFAKVGTWRLAGSISTIGSNDILASNGTVAKKGMADRSMAMAAYDNWITQTLNSGGGSPAIAAAAGAQVSPRRQRNIAKSRS